MDTLYDRQHVEAVLTRVGVPDDRRAEILAEIRFPIRLDELQTVLAARGITHDGLISWMGGSP